MREVGWNGAPTTRRLTCERNDSSDTGTSNPPTGLADGLEVGVLYRAVPGYAP